MERLKCPLCEWIGAEEECDYDQNGIPVCPLCGYNDLEEINE